MRLEVLELENWTCQICRGYGNEVDHIIPIQLDGDPFELDNLQVLCRGCHIQKTRSENRRPNPERDAWRDYLA